MNKTTGAVIFGILFFMGTAGLTADTHVKAGGLLSFAGHNSLIYNASNRFGLQGGVSWSIGIGPVSVRSGIDLARKGARCYSAANRATLLVDLDYVIVPVLLNIHMVGTPIDIFAGPYGGLLIRSTERDMEHDWTWDENRVKKIDYGIEGGIRYRFLKFLFAQLQFDYGLADVIQPPNDLEERVHRNRTLSLLIGLSF